jgi:arylsulfatase A-like enzyme
MLNSARYADYSLGRFFDWARKSSYWRNTVFVVTANRNFGKGRMDWRSRMRIPLLILDPGNPEFPAGRVNQTVGSHMDLPPTLLDMIGVSASQAFLGHSLLRPALHRYVLFAGGSVAGWLTRSSLLLHDLSKPLALYAYRNDPHLSRNLLRDGAPRAGHAEIRQFQSFLQTANNLLIRGRVFPAR